MGLGSSWRPYALVLAVAGTVLTVLGYFLSMDGGIGWMVLTNRGLGLFAIWTAAILIYNQARLAIDLRSREANQRLVHFGSWEVNLMNGASAPWQRAVRGTSGPVSR